MHANYTKRTNIWKFLTPLDSTLLEAFLRILWDFLIFWIQIQILNLVRLGTGTGPDRFPRFPDWFPPVRLTLIQIIHKVEKSLPSSCVVESWRRRTSSVPSDGRRLVGGRVGVGSTATTRLVGEDLVVGADEDLREVGRDAARGEDRARAPTGTCGRVC
jgi:hypothetical protein